VCLGLRLVFFLGLSLFRLEVNTSFLTLLRRNWSWRVRQWVNTAARLREGNDIADGVKAAEQGDNAVPAKGDATVWWCAVLECIQQEAEHLLCFCLKDTNNVYYSHLQLCLLDPDETVTDFLTVAHEVKDIIMCFTWIVIKRDQPHKLRRSNRMVHG